MVLVKVAVDPPEGRALGVQPIMGSQALELGFGGTKHGLLSGQRVERERAGVGRQPGFGVFGLALEVV